VRADVPGVDQEIGLGGIRFLRGAGLTPDETRSLVHDSVSVHRLVTELGGADRPDLGPPLFEVTPRP
jgi:hypothetical protein